MRQLVYATCLLVLAWSTPSQATVKGDPFAEAETDAFSDFSNLEVEEYPFQLGGYLEFRNNLVINDREEPNSIRQRLRLESKWKKDSLSFFGSVDADQELAAVKWKGDGHRTRGINLREAYAMYDTDHVDMFIGRKIQRWGTGDGINPMDVINPLDILDPISTGRADNRLPVFMTGAVVTIEDWNIEGVILPKARVSDLPRHGNPWEPRALKQIRQQESQGLLVLNKADKPDQWLTDGEFGGRISTTAKGWDIAALAFHGHVNSPVLKTDNQGGTLKLTPEYPEFTAYGITVATGLESNTLRGEVAWKPDYPYQCAKTGKAMRSDLVQAVLGWDYNLDSKYYFNVQGFVDAYGLDSSRPYWQHGITYEVSGKWADDILSLGIRGKLHTDGEGALTEFFTDYALTDNWKLLTGVMIWSGPQGGVLGQYDDNDYVYVTLRYSF